MTQKNGLKGWDGALILFLSSGGKMIIRVSSLTLSEDLVAFMKQYSLLPEEIDSLRQEALSVMCTLTLDEKKKST